MNGATVWLTGPPSAGKPAIARALAERLRPGRRLDEVRAHLSPGLGFSREDRVDNVRRTGWLAHVLTRNGVPAVVPVIAPHADTRRQVRAAHETAGTPRLEVHVATPLDACAERDVKGLHARQAGGGLSGLTSADDSYEPPEEAELVLDTRVRPPAESAAQVHALPRERGLA
ncbi:adenylyl-sulfate kinase [Streptomyces sp. B1I3]|uniref:adenylyl-sulfate kinase n=1 Tax=Streptomyces sp. B1I3 TaxID=3042264 RepID=UPI002781D09B|nr:adenylyl-sulfate kinase [Streptomyces sp. B1I3]MDQ0791651.1 adenylylsulfate kinase [Streptomyces sp. B1I3]